MKNKIKLYPLLSVLLIFTVHLSLYYLARYLNRTLLIENFHIIKFKIDNKIPLISYSIIIYFGSYIWWVLSPFLMSKYISKKRYYQFITSAIIVHILTFVIFVLFPTYMVDRPTQIEVNNIFDKLINFMLTSDKPDNLLPSMHTTVSWLCVVPFLTNKEKVPIGIKIFQVVFAILVFISTLTTRQHYIIDVIVGIILVEIVFNIIKRQNISNNFETFFTKVNTKLKIE